MAWASVGGSYGAEMRPNDEGEYLKRDDILPALLKRMARHNAYDAAMALGFSEYEFGEACKGRPA